MPEPETQTIAEANSRSLVIRLNTEALAVEEIDKTDSSIAVMREAADVITEWAARHFQTYHAAKLLGLDYEQQESLFFPCSARGEPDWEDITPAMAAATLESVALTGKVVWPK